MASHLKPLLILATLVLPFASRAQQPFPTYADNGTWSALMCIPGWCGTETYSYEDTDTICGHTWSVYTWPTFGFPGIAYIRNEGQRTLFRRGSDCLDPEYVMYDFSMEVGDSVYAGMNLGLPEGDDSSLFVLQAIDTVQILGVERRRFSLLFDYCNFGSPNMPMQWIEGIGSTMHPFYPLDCMCDFCSQSTTLLCYDSAGVQLYVDPIYGTCDTLITGTATPDLSAANVQIIYDPLADLISVRDLENLTAGNSAFALILMASDGRVVRQQGLAKPASGRARMDVSAIAPGVYAVLLTDGRKRLAGQRIVIQ